MAKACHIGLGLVGHIKQIGVRQEVRLGRVFIWEGPPRQPLHALGRGRDEENALGVQLNLPNNTGEESTLTKGRPSAAAEHLLH